MGAGEMGQRKKMAGASCFSYTHIHTPSQFIDTARKYSSEPAVVCAGRDTGQGRSHGFKKRK
jgi:hypothetical protein